MLVFMDTEFTDFGNAGLISIGLATEDGRCLYLERSDYEAGDCNAFVRERVLPLLGADPDAMCDRAELSRRLSLWLSQFSERDMVVADLPMDGLLFKEALSPAALMLPIQLLNPAVHSSPHYAFGRDGAFNHKSPQHHALNDALAMRQGFLCFKKFDFKVGCL